MQDSGKRSTFDSGMQRDTNEGKTIWALVFDGPILKRYAEWLTLGAIKYSPRNWMKACSEAEMERFRSSAANHFAKWMNGEQDEDHAAAILFNLNGYEYVKERINGRRGQWKSPTIPFDPYPGRGASGIGQDAKGSVGTSAPHAEVQSLGNVQGPENGSAVRPGD